MVNCCKVIIFHIFFIIMLMEGRRDTEDKVCFVLLSKKKKIGWLVSIPIGKNPGLKASKIQVFNFVY